MREKSVRTTVSPPRQGGVQNCDGSSEQRQSCETPCAPGVQCHWDVWQESAIRGGGDRERDSKVLRPLLECKKFSMFRIFGGKK